MGTVGLTCAGASTLFYEEEGLMLCSSLVPVDGQHRLHLLTFQLSYLGPGEIVVHVATTGAPAGHTGGTGCGAATRTTATGLRDRREGVWQGDVPGLSGGPGAVTAAALRGAGAGALPAVWLTYALLREAEVHCRYTVWGQPGDDDLRGELAVEVCGQAPHLTVTTRATVTDRPVPAALLAAPVAPASLPPSSAAAPPVPVPTMAS